MQEFNFEKETTSNGIPVYILSLSYLHTVAAGVVVKAGAVDEKWPQEAGLAHALEHMVLRGTKRFPTAEQLSAYLEDVGGYRTASTNIARTLFRGRTPSEYAERLIEVLAETVNSALIPEERIVTEMQAIQNEMRQIYDRPYPVLNRLVLEHIYQEHPLGRDVIGLPKSVSHFQRGDFVSFKKRHYHAGNYTLIIAGGVSNTRAKKLVEKYFVSGPSGKPNTRKISSVEKKPRRQQIKRGEQKQAYVALAALLGDAEDKDTQTLDLFSTMLGGGPSFPLFQELREKRGLCYQSFVDVARFPGAGMFYISFNSDYKRHKEAIGVIFDLIDKTKSNPALLEKAKRLKRGRLVMGFENLNFVILQAADEIAIKGHPLGYNEQLEEIESVSILDIEKAVDRYLKPEQLSRILLLPEKKS